MARTARRGALGRRDANEPDIIAALRGAGISVMQISKGGAVDLVAARPQKTVLLEVKSKGGRLTDAEREFLLSWPGEAYVVFTPAEALAVFGIEVTE